VAIVTKNKTNHERNIKNMRKYLSVIGMVASFCLTAVSANAFTIWEDNFENGSMKSGWTMYKQVISAAGVNTAPSASDPGIVTGGYYPAAGTLFGPHAVEANKGQGAYSGKIYPDYGNEWGDWDGGKYVAISLYKSHTLTANDIAGGLLQMNLNYKFEPDLGPDSGAFAFMRLGDNWWVDREAFSFNGGNWGNADVSMGVNSGLVGAQIQFGVTTYAKNFQPSGLLIDNVVVAAIPEPSVASLLGFGVLGLVATRFRRRS
jgi:hypothetical protein